MCTIVFIPTGDTSFFLGHNRDESPLRKKAEVPKMITEFNTSVIAPVDGSKRGTWVYTNDQETVLLFNGAFEKHQHRPPYQRSRGKIVFETLEYKNHDVFVEQVNLAGVEPFTQIFIDHDTQRIIELLWDGYKKEVRKLEWAPFIRSSVTLYSTEVHSRKEVQFQSWLANNDANRILEFMQNTDFEIPTILEHPKVKTLSTTVVTHKLGKSTMDYYEYT